MLPSGARWRVLKADGDQEFEAISGQVVRVHYTARLDDGREIANTSASLRLGASSAAVCAVLDEVTPGMRLGDMRRYAIQYAHVSIPCWDRS